MLNCRPANRQLWKYSVRLSNKRFEPNLPYWRDYLSFLQQLAGRDFPACDRLNELLPENLSNERGQAIHFVPSNELVDGAYEHQIYTTGQVSTRPENWHDLFNALVWMQFPNIKTAMNTLHFRALSDQKGGSRGPLRDALTLFDECGVIVFSSDLKILNALAQRRWKEAFLAEEFISAVQLSVSGHAMLEKYLSPYKSMTAKVLLVHVDADFMALSRREMLSRLDRIIARRMLAGELLVKPACLAPLPLAGVPGWWPDDEQSDEMFYLDLQVFRPAPGDLIPAPVISL
jgi:hypothetical protein